jgi:hypothetical protein
MIRKKTLPLAGICPQCKGRLVMHARTRTAMQLPIVTDELEWHCLGCGFEEVERRRKAEGIDGEWPASKFSRA